MGGERLLDCTRGAYGGQGTSAGQYQLIRMSCQAILF